MGTGLYGKVLWWLWLSGNGHVVCYEGGVDGTCLGLNPMWSWLGIVYVVSRV